MKRIKRLLMSSCLVVTVLCMLPLGIANAAGWVVVPSQNPAPINAFNGVAWNQATNVQWAVGYFQKPAGLPFTLTERWNGVAWIYVPSPNMGTGSLLNGVTAQTASPRFWAVGYWINGAGLKQTLTELWNGGAWVIVPSPNVGASNNSLNGVAWDQTTGTAWAVGYSTNALGIQQTLTERWNGAVWAIVPSPNRPPGNNVLNGVAVDQTTGQAHAVGYWTDGAGIRHTLTEIWVGVWKITPSANQGANDNVLNGVAWMPASHLFIAVGYFKAGIILRTLTERWNGGAWMIIPSPSVGASNNALNGIALFSPQIGWAVGYSTNGLGVLQTLTERWTGGGWVVVPSPNVGVNNNVLNAVAFNTPNANAAAVGYSGNLTLAENF